MNTLFDVNIIRGNERAGTFLRAGLEMRFYSQWSYLSSCCVPIAEGVLL
jgi:hypothetical protein